MKLRIQPAAHDVKNGIVSIPIAQIVPSPNQTRRLFSQAALDELATSMEQVGLLQPITVRAAAQKKYELVAGERRLRAARQLGWRYIEARVIDVPQQNAALLTIIENLQRENLNFFEEAESYKLLMQEYGMTQDQIAYRIGKRQSTVSNKLRLLRIPLSLREYVLAQGLTERHVRAALRLQQERLIGEALHLAADEHWTVKQVEDYVAKKLDHTPPPAPAPQQNVTTLLRDSRIFVNAIGETFREIRKTGVPAQMRQRDEEDGIVIEIFLPRI